MSAPWQRNQLSRAAYERLQAELDDLTTRGRIEVAEKIERARELGDLSENGDYHAAKDEQGHMEGRIRQLEHLLENAEIIEAPTDGVVGAGTIVTIVYEGDSDDDGRALPRRPHRGAGRRPRRHQPDRSPLGAALLGADAGTSVSSTRRRTASCEVQVVLTGRDAA